jgi:hypothetical protein
MRSGGRHEWILRALGQVSVYAILVIAVLGLLYREGITAADPFAPRTVAVGAALWALGVLYRAVRERHERRDEAPRPSVR